MRNIFAFFLVLLFISSSCSQLNSEMNSKIWHLNSKIDSLSGKVEELTTLTELQDEELMWLQNELAELKKAKGGSDLTSFTPSATPLTKPLATPSGKPSAKPAVPVSKTTGKEDTRCLALTNSGKRCSRTALEGSDYCWQHKEIYEPEMPEKK